MKLRWLIVLLMLAGFAGCGQQEPTEPPPLPPPTGEAPAPGAEPTLPEEGP